jgi:hypothetical protein
MLDGRRREFKRAQNEQQASLFYCNQLVAADLCIGAAKPALAKLYQRHICRKIHSLMENQSTILRLFSWMNRHGCTIPEHMTYDLVSQSMIALSK